MDSRDKYSWCENPNCEFIYKKIDFIENNIRICPNCEICYCTLCSTELIGNVHNETCKIQILNKLKNEDAKWVLNNTKNCPKCNQLYEKSEGCNHMVCIKCRPEVHFCFICGLVLDNNKYV